jgi:hypothetical protein
LAQTLATNFQLPRPDDAPPAYRRLAGACAWAAALGAGGLFCGVRIVVAMFTTTVWWYEPVVLLVGLIGISCTVGALTSLHQRRLPFALLGLASVALLCAFVLTSLA